MSTAQQPQTAVAETKNKLKAISSVLSSANYVNALQKSLPPGLSAERFMSTALSAIYNNPDLAECTQTSLWASIKQAAQLNLEIGGPLGQCYLIPRNNSRKGCQEATFQIGYKGYLQLAHRSERVARLFAHTVYAEDKFSYQYGSHPMIEHVPAPVPIPKRGVPTWVYACVYFKGVADPDFEVMSMEDVFYHRDKYAKGTNRADSPWKTALIEMSQKTVLLKLAKRLPLSVEMAVAARLDEAGMMGTQGFRGSGTDVAIEVQTYRDEVASNLSAQASGENTDADPITNE